MGTNYNKKMKPVKPHAKQLLESGDKSKIDDLFAKAGKAKRISSQISTIHNMVLDYSSGEYKQVPEVTIVLLVGAIIYFVAPDLIPGPVDDVALLAWAIDTAQEDIERYEDWKRKTRKGIEVEQVESKSIIDNVTDTVESATESISNTLHSIRVGGFKFDVKSEDSVVKHVNTKYKHKFENPDEDWHNPEEGMIKFLSDIFQEVTHVAGLIAEAIDITSMGLDIQFSPDNMKATVAGKHKYSVLDIDELQFFVAKGKHTLVWNPKKHKEEKSEGDLVVG